MTFSIPRILLLLAIVVLSSGCADDITDVVAVPQGGQNPIANPGFESGDFTGWVVQDMAVPFDPVRVVSNGTALLMPATAEPTEGNFVAVAGFDGDGVASPNTVRIAQDITIPLVSRDLLFDYRAGWNNGGMLPRTFTVVIEPGGGGAPLQSTLVLQGPAANFTPDTGWMPGSVDVSAFQGSSVRFSFDIMVPESFTGPGMFQLDDVRLDPPGAGRPPCCGY